MSTTPDSPKPLTPLTSLLHDIKPPAGRPAFASFLLFDWMVTPVLIRALYVLGSLWWILQSLRMMFGRDEAAENLAAMMGQPAPNPFWSGLVALAAGLVGLRVFCESMIVLYRLHENVRAIRDASRPA